jgi:hypothetical protein
MSTKHVRNRYSQRRYHTHNNNRQRPDKRTNRQSPEEVLNIKHVFIKDKIFIQIAANLVQQFNYWCVSLRTKATYEFDHEKDNHRCKVEYK